METVADGEEGPDEEEGRPGHRRSEAVQSSSGSDHSARPTVTVADETVTIDRSIRNNMKLYFMVHCDRLCLQ